MSCRSNCKPDRPSIFVNHVSRNVLDACDPDRCSHDCTEHHDHDNLPCECPLGHIGGDCVHYTGHALFLSQIKPGMKFDEIMYKIEEVFSLMDEKLDELGVKICELNSKLESVKRESDGWE